MYELCAASPEIACYDCWTSSGIGDPPIGVSTTSPILESESGTYDVNLAYL